MKHVISYIRVSTVRQGQSGLGLDAQRAAVASFCHENGCELIAEYQEIESGRKGDRPVLREALAHASSSKATLLIAKLDRLARNVAFIANLIEAGVDFRACDMPEANRLIIHILAAVGEQEARAISERTKAALHAAKERGVRLGASNPASRNLSGEARLRGSRRTSEEALRFYADIAPLAMNLRKGGFSLAGIASRFNAEGRLSRRGSRWTATQIKRILDRQTLTQGS